ncbi:MFS transporter [Streptomyces sp. NRRL S-481]|uniref:MFS transporter n=1 Tax=Streptomyces sp. NRRL S-481 TaxID=1463911 RepID=UPI00068EDEFE|nr:MFS transporter [Streptomyces sp. NRRL S-481]
MSESASPSNSGLGSYLRLLRSPGAGALAFWGMVGRFPIAMRSIGCLMLISAVTGSLGDAGTVAAAMLISQGVAAPFLGRLADRHSQRKVLLTTCLGHAVGMTLLLVSIGLELPLWAMVAAAVVTGCTSVSFTGFMRARWAAFVDQSALRTAYAMESMLDDTIFLLGPLLVTVLSSSVYPAGGLVACAILTVTGSIFVALHRRSEPTSVQRAITVPGVWVLMIAYAGMGFLFGAVDVTMIAFAQERSAPGLGGVLLALIAVGSLVAGAVYGAVNWRVPQVRLLAVTTCVLTLSAVPLAFADSLPVMAVLAVVAGVAVSPALIAGSTLLESVAPKGALSEAFSWLNSCGALGIASGTAVGGQLADLATSAHAAWAGAAGGLVALVLSLVGQSVLRRGALAAQPAPEMATAEQ